MKQERIRYKDIKSLNFNHEHCDDKAYFDTYGFEYTIITLHLTNKIYIDWEKETGFAKIVRTDKKGNIKNERPIKDIDMMLDIIDFFLNEKRKASEDDSSCYNYAC